MPFWIEGWLEVRRSGAQDEPVWSGVLRIGPLVDVADEVSEALFGLSKRLASAPSSGHALAANRGLPSDPSGQVGSELAQQAAHALEFGSGEFGGHTHATWHELVDRLDASAIADSDWRLVFDIARLLAAEEQFKPDGVRFVLWYNW
jgi:hypothetical protein